MGSYLLDSGLLLARSVMKGDVVIRSSPRRNNNYQVVCEGSSSYAIKQDAGLAEDSGGMREAVIYRYLHAAPGTQPVRRHMPTFRAYDEARQILVVDLVKDAEELHAYYRRLGRFPAWVGEDMGRALASLHNLGEARDALRGVGLLYIPWILAFHRPSQAQLRDMSMGTTEVLRMVQQTPAMRAQLDALVAAWRADALIHGDVKASNWLVARPGRRGQSRLKLIDWEMAGVGDARWDVGSVFADYLYFWLTSMDINAEEGAPQFVRGARYQLSAMQPALGRFWRAYAIRRGFSEAERREYLSGAVRFAGARLVQTAYEQCQELTRVTLGTLRLLQLALNIMQRPLPAAADLLGIGLEEGAGGA